MQSTFSALTHGSPGLVLGYFSVVIPMMVGLIRKRADTPRLLSAQLIAIPVGFASCIAAGYACALLLARSSKPGPSYRRGTVVMPGESADEAHRHDHPQPRSGSATDFNAPLSLAGIRIANEDETKYFKFIATTRTGKSTAIREILSAALARGYRAVIADPTAADVGVPPRGELFVRDARCASAHVG